MIPLRSGSKGWELGGFTLIELMVSIAIVAVLTSIMLPAYQGQVRKSQRVVGRAVLLEILARQEQFFIFNKQYADKLVSLGYTADPLAIGSDGEEVAKSSQRKIYLIHIENALPEGVPQRFDLRAVPQLSQARDSLCGALIISSRGTKSAGRGAASDCW